MVSSNTLHVVSTELTVGSFAMAGAAFLCAGLASHHRLGMQRHLHLFDHVAHFALAFGLLAMPMAIATGIASSPETVLTIRCSSTKCSFHALLSALPWAC